MLKKINEWLTAKPQKRKQKDYPWMPQFLLDLEYKIDMAFRFIFWLFILPFTLLLGVLATVDTSRGILIDMFHFVF